MKKFLKNLTATMVSSLLFIVRIGSLTSTNAATVSQSYTSAEIQQKILDDCNINKLKEQISKNEKKLNYLENGLRSKLDHRLSKKLDLKEQIEKKLNGIFSWIRRNKLNKELNEVMDEIKKIKKEISKNESRISELKQIREYYDYKLADILQRKSEKKIVLMERFRNV